MTMPTHGRYSYRPVTEPVGYKWPNSKRLAVYVAVNLEIYDFDAEHFDEFVPNTAQPDLINFAWLDWGNRVGAWRLLEAMKAKDIPATVLVNSRLYDAAPGLVEAWRASGAEIVGHGRTNGETQAGMDVTEERSLITKATAEIAHHEGRAPSGWLSPWIAETSQTPELLAEAGYRYVLDWACDDRPFTLNTKSGPLLAMPYPIEANDANAIATRRASSAEFCDICLSQIDEMLRQAEEGPLVCPIALHPHIIGQAHRLHHFHRVLAHLSDLRDDIWLTTAGEIAAVAQS